MDQLSRNEFFEKNSLNEALSSKILTNLRRTLNPSKGTNFFKALANLGITVDKITDDQIEIISPKETFGSKKSKDYVVLITNDDEGLKSHLVALRILSPDEAKDKEVLIGAYRNGEAMDSSGRVGKDASSFIGLAHEMSDSYYKKDMSKAFTEYLGEDFNGTLNQKNVLKISNKAYVFDLKAMTNAGIRTARVEAKHGALALKKLDKLAKENRERYRTLAAENTNIVPIIGNVTSDYTTLINKVIELKTEDSQVYSALDNLTQSFSSFMRRVGDFYRYQSTYEKSVRQAKDNNKDIESYHIQWSKDSATDSKKQLKDYYQEFLKYKQRLLISIDEDLKKQAVVTPKEENTQDEA